MQEQHREVCVAAIVFDVRQAERQLIEAGASANLAKATADLMSQAVLLNLDALVTKDYLDARLDARFGELDGRFANIDARFGELEARFSERCLTIDGRIDQLRTEVTGQFRLVHALLMLLLAGVFIPLLQSWFVG